MLIGTLRVASSAYTAEANFGHLMFWRRSISDDEIRQLYRDPLAPFRQRRFTPTYSPVAEAAATTSVGWTRSLTPSPVRPSYKSGFARSASTSAYPGLWPDAAWIPSLGATGQTLINVVNPAESAPIAGGLNSDWGVHGGKFSFDFDGTDCVAELPWTIAHKRFSMHVLARPDAVASKRVMALDDASTNNVNHWLMFHSGGKIQYQARNTGSSNNAETATSYTAGQWHAVTTVTRGASDRSVYLDGGGRGNNTATINGELFLLDTLAIGGTSDSTPLYFDGQIAVVLFYRRSLTDAEVAILGRDSLAPFRQRRFTPTYSPVAEEAAATTSVGWYAAPTPSPVRPSYKSGFARSRAESASPGLWPAHAWVPALGVTGASTLPDVVSGNSGTLNGAMTGSDWIRQNGLLGLNFDGLNDYASVAASSQMTISDNFTIHTTMSFDNFGTGSDDDCVFSNHADDVMFSLSIRDSTDLAAGFYYSGSFQECESTPVSGLVAGTVYAVTAICRSGTVELWIDAVRQNGIITAPGRLIDGAAIGARTDGTSNLDGTIFSTSVYHRALDPNEIRQLYRDPLSPFRQRRFTPTYPTAAEAAAEWQPYWVPRMTQRIIGSGVR